MDVNIKLKKGGDVEDFIINTVIFDLEGVIIDSEPLWTESDMLFLKNNGIEITLDYYEANIKPDLIVDSFRQIDFKKI